MAVLARAEITLARVEIDEVVEQVGEVTAKVNGVEQQVTSLTAEVAGAVEDASEALTSVSSLEQDVSGFKTTVAQTYETKADADAAIAQERLDRQSAVEQSATQILQQVSETYLDKETGESLATKAEVEQTADGIRSEVSETYQTKAGMSAYATSSSVQQTAESIMSEVATEYQTKDGMSSYATKSYVDQQDDSISSTVSSVQATADSALAKASTVEQTADALQVTLTSTTATADDALSKAKSAASAASTAQAAATDAAKTATNFLKFDSSGLCVGDQTAGSLGMNALVAASKISLRSGSAELATFSPTLIELGKNSQGSAVRFSGGALDIGYDEQLLSSYITAGNGKTVFMGDPGAFAFWATGSGVSMLNEKPESYSEVRVCDTGVEVTGDIRINDGIVVDNSRYGASNIADAMKTGLDAAVRDRVPNTWFGTATVSSIPAGGYKDQTFMHSNGWTQAPLVIPVFSSSSGTALAYGRVGLVVKSRSANSTVIRCINSGSAAASVAIMCIAISRG